MQVTISTNQMLRMYKRIYARMTVHRFVSSYVHMNIK